LRKVSPFDPEPALNSVSRGDPEIQPTDFYWDNDPSSGNCALRGKNGEVLRVIIQTGSSWSIYQNDMLLDICGTRKEARERALEMWRAAGR
jgi:hypothetical protein